MTRRIAIITTLALLVLAPASFAEETTFTAGEAVELHSGSLTLESEEGRRTFTYDADIARPADLEVGDRLIVQHSGDRALSILELHDQVLVSRQLDGQRRAVYGTVKSTGTEQVIVNTSTGGQAFAIQTERLFPPLPEPGDKVAVIYRVETTQTQEFAKGERLVLLPADFELPTGGRVRVSSTPIPRPAVAPVPSAEAEGKSAELEDEMTLPAPEPERFPAPAASAEVDQAAATRLPQTASPLWLLGAIGVASLGGGLAARKLRK
ncbi:MAG: hypothetical protein R3190_17865 [Thermoanaerobaculia bacterium]|nr:hypothetical protein [Thermoanaerobaculia bacterium]